MWGNQHVLDFIFFFVFIEKQINMDNRSNVKLVGNTTIVNNIGDGIGIYACKINGNNLQFKTLYATGNSISLISFENKIYIS